MSRRIQLDWQQRKSIKSIMGTSAQHRIRIDLRLRVITSVTSVSAEGASNQERVLASVILVPTLVATALVPEVSRCVNQNRQNATADNPTPKRKTETKPAAKTNYVLTVHCSESHRNSVRDGYGHHVPSK